MMHKVWLTAEQVAAHLNIAPITIYRWIEGNKIPCQRVGHQWRFSTLEIDQWVFSSKASDLKKLNRKRI
ncbi:MAG: helix-turn-helix domain-containing protein [Bdellovibrionales bacterium]|jgi:PTS system nitrogen regulatory IIA component|nr:helix-turn-helix domain-containing protein [Bdellovibrionales bacterium]